MLKHKKIDSWSITNQLTLLKDTTPPPLIFRVIDINIHRDNFRDFEKKFDTKVL